MKRGIRFNSRVCAGSSEGSGEDGYILLGVLFLMVLVLMALAIAAPKVAAEIQRDREVELMHRGKQYQRAIQLYYRKFNAYPPNMEALEKSNNIRFLRRRYVDPITGKDEWHLIHFGENRTPTVMGFFNQPMAGAGSTLAGTGPGGVGQNIGNPVGGGSSNAGGSIFGGGQPGSGGSIFGGSTPGSNGSVTPDPNAANPGLANPNNAGGQADGQAGGTPTDPNAAAGSTTGGSTSGSSSMFANSTTSGSGQTFGGGGIIGVESTSPKATILEYKKKKHFNEWEFVYDPQQERLAISNNTGSVGQGIGGAGNGTSTPTVNSPSLNNQPNGQPAPTPQQPQQPQQQDPQPQ